MGARQVVGVADVDTAVVGEVHGDLARLVEVEAHDGREFSWKSPGGGDDVVHLAVPGQLIEHGARELSRDTSLQVPALVRRGARRLCQHLQKDLVGVGVEFGHDGSCRFVVRANRNTQCFVIIIP